MRALLCAGALLAVLAGAACSGDSTPSGAESSDSQLPPFGYQLNGDPGSPPAPAIDPNAPPLDLRVTKSMIYAAAVQQHLNPSLAMGLGWWESGWNQSAV